MSLSLKKSCHLMIQRGSTSMCVSWTLPHTGMWSGVFAGGTAFQDRMARARMMFETVHQRRGGLDGRLTAFSRRRPPVAPGGTLYAVKLVNPWSTQVAPLS